MTNNKIALAFALVLTLGGCGGDSAKPNTANGTVPAGGSSGGAPENPDADADRGNLEPGVGTGGNAGVAAIAGLWDQSETGADGLDIGHLRIDADGSITIYDYQGDEADEGPDCAIIGTGIATNVSGETYSIAGTLGGETVTETGQASIVGATLVTNFVDTDDQDNDGDTTETITESYPAATNVPAAQLTACPS